MSIKIRSERAGDEEAIDVVNCQAFRSRDEAYLVELVREIIPTFDRRLSITAWDADQMVGHALFTPANVRLLGETVTALAVGPVAVIPSRQKQGIGTAMLQHGHELGQREGFAFAFLNGHSSYYPRLGYRECFGFANVTIDMEKLPPSARRLVPWPVRPGDVPWLIERYAAEWADVDFAWLRGSNLAEWTFPGVNAVVWRTEDGVRAGYALRSVKGDKLKLLLSDNAALARDVIATTKPSSLEHHPSGWLARNALDAAWSNAEANRSGAAMAIELQKGSLDPVIEAVETGQRPPGVCKWPIPFMLC